MISSGMKRGLAASAVSALAIAGVPLLATSASAVPNSSAVDSATALYLATPLDGSVSTKNDGSNSTVDLHVVAGNSVSAVKFEYSLGGAYTTISTVSSRTDSGTFAYEWTPAGLDGGTVTIRATGLAADGTTTVGTPVTKSVAVSSTLDSTHVTDGTQIGVFQKPDYDGAGADTAANNVIVTGSSSKVAGTPTLSFWDDDTDTGTAGNQPGWAGAKVATSTTAAGATTGTWAGILDITGYNFGTGDELLVKSTELNGAGATDNTDDAEAYSLYKQVITTVSASADRTNVPSGQTAAVTVTVKDQNGNPIPGAEVRDSGGVLIGQTDIKGQVATTQGPGSKTYYANATDSDSYEPEVGDKQSDAITVTQYTATSTTLAGASADGAAFDIDENSATDISVQIKDQNGNNLGQSRTGTYYWVETPFDGSPATQRVPATGTTAFSTDASGKATFTLPAVTDADGTYELYASLDADGLGNGAIASSKVLTFKAGEATFKYTTTGNPDQAAAGTSATETGTLALADGTALAGRNIDFTFARGAVGTDATPDAYLVNAAGTAVANNTASTFKTDASGKVSVTVKDPAETPQGTETGGQLTAAVAGNADASPAARGVDFVASVTPGIVTITDNNAAIDRPGELVGYTVHITTGDLDPATPGNQTSPITNSSVTLKLDHGYFTDGTAATLPTTVGGKAGAYKVLGTDNGQTLTVTTNGSGDATVTTSMGRDTGFDDDGKVTSTLTATAGTATKTQTHAWDSSDPINGGKVTVEASPAEFQDGDQLPSAAAGQDVALEVNTEDQFGNPVAGETVTITENGAFSDISGDDDSGTAGVQVVTDLVDNADLIATATRAGDQTVTATWLANTYTYTNTTGTAAVGADAPLTGSYTIEWYAVDFATSDFTITSDPEGDVPVNGAVTETVKVVDQNGNPVSGLDVRFVVNGPGSQTADVARTTNANGEAFYTVVGSSAGTANVSAIVSDGEQVKTLSDSINFVAPAPVSINLTASAKDKGKKDQLTIKADDVAAGLVAKVFVNGKQVASHKLNGTGDATFKVADKNGNKKTKYTVKVAATDATKAASKTTNAVK